VLLARRFLLTLTVDDRLYRSGAAELANGREYVVKAQVHAGGRGKGYFKETGYKGGVHVVNSYGSFEIFIRRRFCRSIIDVLLSIASRIEAAAKAASEMMGKHLVTKQTTDEGVLVNKVRLQIFQATRLSGAGFCLRLVDCTV
jgi:succinyl-CoA synthetase beta subunit